MFDCIKTRTRSTLQMVFFNGDLKRGDFANLEVSEATKRCHGRPAGGTKEKAPASSSVPFQVFLVKIQQQQMSDLLTGIRGETLYISRETVI